MTRETKIGIAMALLLMGVFGFLVYKRMHRPGDGIVQAGTTDGEDDINGDGLSLTKADDNDPDENQPGILPVNASRPIPQSEPSDVDDPFGGDEIPQTAKATRSLPSLPTGDPDDDGEEEFLAGTAANGSEDPEPVMAGAGEPESEESDPFDGGAEVNEQPTTTPVIATRTAPALEFETEEAKEEEELGDFVADEHPVVRTAPPVRQPVIETFETEDTADEEATVSVQARGKIPEESFDFGEEEAEEEEAPMMVINVQPREPATRAAPPQLTLDDSNNEDRYGGYEPAEFAGGPAFRDEKVRTEAFAKVESDRTTITITGHKHVIQAGENFWTISQKKYGTGRYFQALAAHNKSRIPDAAKMKPGIEISLPSAEDLERRYPSLIVSGAPAEPAAEAHGAGGANGEFHIGNDGRPLYKIGAGDTLSGIAQKYLGRARRWEQILEMNRDVLKDGNSLKVGAVLRLPHDAAQLQLSSPPRNFR